MTTTTPISPDASSIQRASLSDTIQTIGRLLQGWIVFVAPVVLLILWEALVRGDFRIGNFVLLTLEKKDIGLLGQHLFTLDLSSITLDQRFFAKPSEIYPELKAVYQSGLLVSDVWATTYRVIYGFVLGATPAILLGLLMGSSTMIYRLFQPLAEALYATPKIAFLPLVIFLYGLSEKGLVRIVAFSVFFLVLLSVIKSIRQVDPKYREIAKSFGAKPVHVFFNVTLPASMPGIVNSLQLGLGFALVVIVGAEFFTGDKAGLGFRIWRANELFDIVRYFAYLIAVGIMGYVLALLLARITRMMVPWQIHQRRPQPTWLQQKLNVYWIAMRPWSFIATIVPILIGSAIAGYHRVTMFEATPEIISLRPKIGIGGYDWTFNWVIFGLALVGSIAFQAGTNLVNDYYDHVKGADTEKSLGVGGVIQRGDLSPRTVLIYGILCFVVGSGIGLYLVSVTGPFILFLGVFSVLAGFFYTAGPVALSYIGLGEVTVGVFMGPVIIIGAYFVQVKLVTLDPLLASLPIAFLVAAILHANNLRDLESDREIGKRTLATLVGRKYANIEYYVLISATYVSQIALVLVGIAPIYTLISLATIPSALALMYRVAANTDPAALNPVLRRTAQLQMRFGLLVTAGWCFAIMNAAYTNACGLECLG